MSHQTEREYHARNVERECAALEAYFSPRVIGEVNDQYVKVAKIKGEEIPWHAHEEEDELFYIIDGTLLMECEHRTAFTMSRGEFFVVNMITVSAAWRM